MLVLALVLALVLVLVVVPLASVVLASVVLVAAGVASVPPEPLPVSVDELFVSADEPFPASVDEAVPGSLDEAVPPSTGATFVEAPLAEPDSLGVAAGTDVAASADGAGAADAPVWLGPAGAGDAAGAAAG